MFDSLGGDKSGDLFSFLVEAADCPKGCHLITDSSRTYKYMYIVYTCTCIIHHMYRHQFTMAPEKPAIPSCTAMDIQCSTCIMQLSLTSSHLMMETDKSEIAGQRTVLRALYKQYGTYSSFFNIYCPGCTCTCTCR